MTSPLALGASLYVPATRPDLAAVQRPIVDAYLASIPGGATPRVLVSRSVFVTDDRVTARALAERAVERAVPLARRAGIALPEGASTPQLLHLLDELRTDEAADVAGLRRRQLQPCIEHPPQRATLEQLDDHERDALVLAPVVDGHHVRVVERGGELGLRAEPAEEPGVVRERGVEHLHRDTTTKADVVGHVHPAAGARSDRTE